MTRSGWRLPVNTGPAQCFSPVSHCSNWPVTASRTIRGDLFPARCGCRCATSLWLQVRDLEATQTELVSRGVSIAREPRREPWGLHEMHVTDPDGITLIFVEVPEGHPLRTDTRA